jgi:probable rRNA maturation factor
MCGLDHRLLRMMFLFQSSRSFVLRTNFQKTLLRFPKQYTGRFFSKDTTTSADIQVFNHQFDLPDINQDKLKDIMFQIRSILGYENYSVSLYLIHDEMMQEINRDSRNVDEPTDILSFPLHNANQPGKLNPPMFNIPDLYCLGEMLVDVPYVIRRCHEDAQEETPINDNDVEEEERGVSAAMSKIYDPEIRIQMLLIHGMLHLVGYDHIQDDDYYCMVAEEERILQLLNLVKDVPSIQ